VIERYNVKGAVRRVCVGWWSESVLCCAVCVVYPASVCGLDVGCDAVMRESGCEAVRAAGSGGECR
jgi:hypothetical protein